MARSAERQRLAEQRDDRVVAEVALDATGMRLVAGALEYFQQDQVADQNLVVVLANERGQAAGSGQRAAGVG